MNKNSVKINITDRFDRLPEDGVKHLKQTGTFEINLDVPMYDIKNKNYNKNIKYRNDVQVVLKYWDHSISRDASDSDKKYFRFIEGDTALVFIKVMRIIANEHRNKFHSAWVQKLHIKHDRFLKDLANFEKRAKKNNLLEPSNYEDKGFGLYTTITPAELLTQKLKKSGFIAKEVAKAAGVDEATLYRHLGNTSSISRDDAVQYGKVFGCDPASILFNDLYVPVWGSVNFEEMKSYNKKSVYAGEVIKNGSTLLERELVICPRGTYRPDVHAIKLDGGAFNGNIAFYYFSHGHKNIKDGQLVVAGVKIKDFGSATLRLRYFVGMVERNGNTFNLVNPDTTTLDLSNFQPDEDFNTFDDLSGYVKENRLVIEDIKPEFIAPIVSIVNPTLVEDNEYKQTVLRNYVIQYNSARKAEIIKDEKIKEEKDLYEFRKNNVGKLIISPVKNMKRYFRVDGAKEIDKTFAKGTNNVTLFEVDRLVQKYSIYHPVLKKYLDTMGIFSPTEEMKKDIRNYTDGHKDIEDKIA